MLAFLGGLLWLERRRPLRASTDPGPRRIARNLLAGGLTAITVTVCERPLTQRLSQRMARRRAGGLQRLGLPRGVQTALALVLLDYTLYLWHILLHRVPWLWRFHLVHHIDRDLDASTALRFHFGEFLASIPWRLGQIALIGVTPRALALWQGMTAVEVVFHHANLRLPPALERALRLVIVTPRLHGVHHSIVHRERDSNFSSGLTLWDRLHGTLRADVPQAGIVIGVPPYHARRPATLGEALGLPFRGGATKAALPPPAGPPSRDKTRNAR